MANSPTLFGLRMHPSLTGFQLSHADWRFRITSRTLSWSRNETWSYSFYCDKLVGFAMSERDYDSPERAAAELEHLLSSLAIAIVVTERRRKPAAKKAKRARQPATKRSAKSKRKASRRKR